MRPVSDGTGLCYLSSVTSLTKSKKMKIVVTILMLMAVVGFFYWLFKDAKFSSLDFRRKKQKLDQEDKPA
jgi:Tfp pilus assembly protein PilO